MNDNVLYIIPAAGLIALFYTYISAQWVANREVGTDRMARIAKYITDGPRMPCGAGGSQFLDR